MGYQIIRQPGGQFAIFSHHTNTIVVYDATDTEIVDWFVEQETARVRERVTAILAHVTDGEPGRAYHQFAMTWDEALQDDREHDGEVHAVFAALDPSS